MIWPFRRTTTRRHPTDKRLDALDERLDRASRTVAANGPRVDSARSRAEAAADRRRRAIAENHLDQLFTSDLRGGASP